MNLTSFTQTYVVTDPYDFISAGNTKGGLYWLLFSIPLVPMGTEAFKLQKACKCNIGVA